MASTSQEIATLEGDIETNENYVQEAVLANQELTEKIEN